MNLFKEIRLAYFATTLLFLSFFHLNEIKAQCNANAGPDVVRCIGSNLQLDGSGSTGSSLSYDWSPAVGLSCTNCPNPVCTVNSTTTYTLEVSSGGCTDTDQITVTVATPPTASFTFTQSNNCANFPVAFTNTSTGTGLSYQWNFDNTASGSQNSNNTANPVHEFVSEGSSSESFNVQLIVTDVNGCQSTSLQNININQTPGPDLVDPFNEMKNCDGTNFAISLFNNSVSSSNSQYRVIWGDGSADFSSANFPGGGLTHTYTANDIFDAYFIVTGNNGCVDTSHHVIANITNPAIGAANPGGTNGCGPLDLCFPLNNYNSNHPTTYYVIDYGDGSAKDTILHPPPNSICHTYTESSCGLAGNSFTFRIKAINLCDSSEATISPIRVYIPPSPGFDPLPNPACVGSNVNMNHTTVAGYNSSCSQSTLVNWDFGDGNTSTQFSVTPTTHSYSTPGTYTITLNAGNNCATNDSVKTICIEDAPTPEFTITPDTACAPFIASINDLSDLTNTCNVTYLWTVIFNGSSCLPSSGTYNFVNGTTASDVEPQIQFVDPGQYTVRLTLTNSCGSFIYDQQVLAKGPPVAVINPVGPICAGASVVPTAQLTHCYDSINVFSWNFSGGNPTTSNVETPGSVTYPNSGTFNITLEVENACGSHDTITTILVNGAPAGLIPTVNSPLCEGDTALFNAPTVAGLTYSWSGENGFTSSIEDPVINTVSSADSGWYYLSGSSGGCPGPVDSVLLVIVSAPVISVIPNSATICQNESVTLTASGANSYTWSPSTGLNVTNQAVVEASPSSTQTYTVEGTVGTCSNTANVTVTVNTLPVVTAGNDLTLCNQPITETLIGTPVGGTWSGQGGIDTNGDFTPSSVGTFEVYYSFTDGNSCSNEDTVLITVNDPVAVSVGNDTAICLNSGFINFTGNPTGGTWAGTGVTTTGDFTPSTVGTFTLTYALGSGSCQTTDDLDVTVHALPVVNAGNDQSICIDNGVITLSGTPVGGDWSGIGISANGDFNPEVAGVGGFTLTYTYIDPVTNCENADQVIITVNDLPVVNAGNDTTFCNQPVAANLSGTPVGGIWTGPNITSPAGEFTPSGVGSFEVYFTFTDGNNCVNKDTVLVTVVDPTDADAGLDSTFCIDAAAVQLIGTPTGGTWSGSGITNAGIYTPTLSGTFTMTYTFGTGSCLTTDQVDLIVNPLPIVDAGSDFDICIDAVALTLSGTPTGGTWSGLGITNPSGEFTASSSGAGIHTLTYSYVDPVTNCENLDTLHVTVNTLPVVDAGVDTTLCNQPFPVQFMGTPAGGVWSGQDITSTGVFTPTGVGSVTVTYTFTLGTGCENSDDRVITIVDPIQADAGLDREICIDEPDFQLNGLPNGGTWSGVNITSGGLFSPIQAGTFELIYSFGAGNCETKDTMEFIVHALPIVSAGLDQEFCISEPSFNFTGSPSGGIWSGTGLTDVNAGTFDPGIAGVAVHELVYTYSDPITTCVNTDTAYADVHPLPQPGFTYNPIMCIGVSEDIINTTALGDTYSWNFGDGNSSTQVDPQYTYFNTGFYDIQVVSTSVFGCVDSLTQQVEVREPPVADFTILPDSGCAPLQVAFTNNSSGVQISFSWDFGNGTTSVLQDPADVTYFQSYYADTTYYITLDVTNFCGTVTDIDSVQVMPSPTAVFGPSFDIGCSPWPAEIANNSVGLPDTYFWDFGDGTIGTFSDSLFNHTYTTGTLDTTYTMMLVVQNECGQDTGYHTVTVLPNQVSAFYNTSITNGCEPLTVNFTQLSQGSNLFFSWDFGDGNTSTVYSPTHTFTNAGTYTVSLFVNDGCSYDTTTVDITVHPSPIVDFTSTPDSVCVNSPFVFNNLSVGLASSTWDFGDGAGTSLLTNPSYSYSQTGVYQVTLTGIGLTNGCSTTVVHPVVVSVQPVASFVAVPISGCVPLPVDFTNTSSNYSFSSWDFADGNTTNQTNPSHTFTTAGSYPVQLLVENANGCRDSISQMITVYPLPNANFNIASTDACYAPVTLTTSNLTTGAVGYDWDFGDGNTSNLNNPSNVFQTPGTYTIELTAISIHGCVDIASTNFTVYPLPEAAFTLPSDTACVGEPLTFVSLGDFADSVVWDFGNGEILSGDSVIYNYPGVGLYSITIMAYGAGGCGDTLTLNGAIVINPTPSADFSYVNVQNPDPLSGTVEFTNLSTGAITYNWEFGNGQNSDEINPIHRFRQIGEFNTTLYSTNEYGCTDSITQVVLVEYFKGLHVPNAMYPAHPSFEVSHFLPKGVGLQSYHIWIYNPWGNQIWESTLIDADGRPVEAWDGTFNGEPMPQDAYVWKVEAIFTDQTAWQGKQYKDGIYRASGTVTLIR
ncbi:MAG: PKD domain-containing protein [Flavobacteriales bacterium]|nr:PKD domain-containing protein [Flavobacteriales bacterium]